MKKLFCLALAAMLLGGCAGNHPLQTPPEETAFVPQYVVRPADEPEDPHARLQWRRTVAEQQMRHMMSVRWTPAQTFTYSAVPASAGVQADMASDPDQVITLYAGRIYQGIPYTHGSNGSVSFLSYATSQDENGVYTLTGLHEDMLTGISRSAAHRRARIGNDCADAVAWAWSTVSSSITFNDTVQMTEAFGIVKVGDYECNEPIYTYSTTDICANNGKQRMFEAYAQMQKADAMVRATNNGSGHAIMIVDVHVERTAMGEIDPEKSYATILEQDIACEQEEKSYYDEELGQTVYLCEELDRKRTFSYLFAAGYLPVTCKELVDPADLPKPLVIDPEQNPGENNMFVGNIEATYRISYVTVTVYSGAKQLQQSTCFAVEKPDKYSFDLTRFLLPTEQAVLKGKLDLKALEPGDYRCTFTCRLATGDEILFRDFTFTVG